MVHSVVVVASNNWFSAEQSRCVKHVYFGTTYVLLRQYINSCNERHSTIDKQNSAAKCAKILAELACNSESIFTLQTVKTHGPYVQA